MKTLFMATLFCLAALGQTTFTLGSAGCPAVGCTPHEDDNSPIVPPIKGILEANHDTTAGLASGGLNAAVSNGTYFAVNFTAGEVRVYDGGGNAIYNTGTYFGSGGCTPIIGTDGSIISADQQHIARFGPGSGTLTVPVWQADLPYHGVSSATGASDYRCVSLKVTSNGMVTVMTINGPMATFNATTGNLVGGVFWPGGARSSFYGGNNSGCSDNNRIYLVGTLWTSPAGSTTGKVVAVDVSSSSGLSTGALSETFTGPSQASPMCASVSGTNTIYTDTDSVLGDVHTPGIIAVQDAGSTLATLWTRTNINLNYAQNCPRLRIVHVI